MNFIFTSISLLCAVVISDAIETEANKYRGCYEFNSKNTLVSNLPTSNSRTLKPETCVRTCADKGFSFAGLERETCRCGSHAPTDLLKRSRSECNIPCPGDESKFCGGKSKISLYETGVPMKELIPSRIYLGCFLDNVEPYRILKGPTAQFPTDLTHDRCHRHCYSIGFRYFGLTYEKECWCGDTAPDPGRLRDESECDSICRGNGHERCGGGWRTAVFATGIPDHSESSRYVSCYKNAQSEIQVEYQIKLTHSASNRRCLNLCYERNYKYSGIQDKNMCTCTNAEPGSSFQVDDYSCMQEPCPGDSGDMCAINNHIRIFRTRHGDTAESDSNQVNLGCFQDQEDYRTLDGDKIESIKQLTRGLCVDICKTRGFEFAGVEGGNECYCSHSYPTQYSRVSNDQCRIDCVGDPRTDCGGLMRVNVFSTGLPQSQALVSKWYMGCYKDDNKDDRMFRGKYSVIDDNSPDICHRNCLKLGYKYFGLTFYRECFCGDEDPFAGNKLSENDCKQECQGDSNKKCGGPWRLSVYRTGLFDISPDQVETLGCFSNDGNLLTDRKIKLNWSNSPIRCTNICYNLGYKYAGVEQGIECRCGNQGPEGLPEQDDSECALNCPGTSDLKCGGTKQTEIFRTPVPGSKAGTTGNCESSITMRNRKKVCKNSILLNEEFDSKYLNTTTWTVTKKMAYEPDFEFVTYTSSGDVLDVRGGILFIKPKIQDSKYVMSSLTIFDCTGVDEECSRNQLTSVILPPIDSAQITTKNSLSFTYGRVEIKAKLPTGDWIVPEIWLSPLQYTSYGAHYRSGQIRIAMVRGNSELTCDGEKLGNRYLQAGLYLGRDNELKKILFTKEMPENWLNDFHTFSIEWTADNIIFYVDGELISKTLNNPRDTVRSVAEVSPNAESIWRSGTKLAPFDQEFYVTLGVSVGGITDFPNDCVSKGKKKPWKASSKAMVDFWEARDQWSQTWKNEESALQVDYVKVIPI